MSIEIRSFPAVTPFSIPSSLQDILLTAVDLLKLEKLEIGGVRGRALSQQVQLLHQEFVDTYKFLTEKPYDCLDLNNRVWSDMMAGCIKLLSTSHSTCLFFPQPGHSPFAEQIVSWPNRLLLSAI